MHKFSEKHKKAIEDKQQKKAKTAREVRVPLDEAKAACYVIKGKAFEKGCVYGVPVMQFKASIVNACSHIDGVTKVLARGAIHVMADEAGLCRLKCSEPIMREDTVRIGMGTLDLRYRPEFAEWSCDLLIRYNAAVITPGQIVNLLNVAGFACGLGELRPQKCGGSNGMFSVAS